MKTKELNKFKSLPEVFLFALCIWGEARGESTESKIAVASVIKERVRLGGWYGKGYKGVILKNKQFSCFNSFDPNFKKMLRIVNLFEKIIKKTKGLSECYTIAQGIISGKIPQTIRATHYLSIYCDAYWEEKLKKVATIGNHDFYI